MKTFSFLLFLSLTSGVFSQETTKTTVITPEPVNQKTEPIIIRGIDITEASPNEEGFILFMETLTDEEAMRLLRSMVKGEIVFKTQKE
jgi:hypothetical protein